MPLICDLHHVSLIVADTTESLRFYRDVLGLTPLAERPELAFPGAWFAAGDGGRQIHLLELPNPDPIAGRPIHGGRDRHLALRVSSLDELIVRLAAAALPYTLSHSGRRALFCRDPDGNALEFIDDSPSGTNRDGSAVGY